jgi:hypothetical protein
MKMTLVVIIILAAATLAVGEEQDVDHIRVDKVDEVKSGATTYHVAVVHRKGENHKGNAIAILCDQKRTDCRPLIVGASYSATLVSPDDPDAYTPDPETTPSSMRICGPDECTVYAVTTTTR